MKTNIKNRVVLGNWNSPREWLSNHKSVVMAGYYNQTSSAGDWGGYFVQKFGGKIGVFLFAQENGFPKCGYHLAIEEYAIGTADRILTREEVVDFVDWYLTEFIL